MSYQIHRSSKEYIYIRVDQIKLFQNQVKNILFQQDHSIICINQNHQHSLVKKRVH